MGFVMKFHDEAKAGGSKHPFNEAGRRIKAAVLSSLTRDKGVDNILEQLPEEVERGWADLGERLVRHLNGQTADKLNSLPRKPFRIK